LSTFFQFLPQLIGAIIVLLLGWFISGGLGKLVERGLRFLGLEKAMEQTGVNDFVRKSGTDWTTSKVIGELTKWFVFLIFIQAGASLLAMPQITAVVSNIILYIPNVVVALVILVAGIMLARFVGGLVRSTLTGVGLENPDFLARLCEFALVAFASIAAIDQLGIAQTVINTLFMGLVGALALAFGLAFGLGGRDVAARITQDWYSKGTQVATQMQQKQLQSQGPVTPQAQSMQPQSMQPPPVQPGQQPPKPTPPQQPKRGS
jgi:hypothetical protein